MIDVKPGVISTVAIAATFTAEPLLPSLRFMLNAAGLSLGISFAPYNQVFQQLLTSTSLLAGNDGGINVVLVRVEDFTRNTSDNEQARLIIGQIVSELCSALTQHGRRAQMPTVFAALPPSPRFAGIVKAEIEAANTALLAHARSVPGIVVLSPEDIDLVSTQEHFDDAGDRLAHLPYTEEHYAALALAIARKVHALRVPAHKVLVLDCDETLWRGVVGEDGIDGLSVPPQLAQLQAFAVKAQAQGTLICLVSKNSERDVLEVFEKRSDMILKLDHIVAHRINWDSKPRNIASLARSLKLGLDSFVFIDDNPVECELMRTELPQVVTMQLPPLNEVDSFLSHLWCFDKVGVTEEDVRRTAMYHENAARQASEESATDIAAFIASLKVVPHIAAPDDSEWPRLAQLTQRTNQFNFSTVRRSESEMRALPDGGYSVLRVKVRDRFGDYGIVGLLIVKAVERALFVDTFLLSCRVLGRGVEHAILRRLGEMARERNLSQVELPFIPTPKNEPAYAFVESVAASFREPGQDRIIYRIPSEAACAIAHQPGHDPGAVIEARKSEERKGAASSTSRVGIEGTERYAQLAQTLVSDIRVLQAVRLASTRTRSLPGHAVAPTADTERRLLDLWEELLGIDGLGVDDDFFTLGGTSLVAARLFAQIERHFAVRMSLTAILESRTVRTLAQHLERQGTSQVRSLIELKSGGPRNLFLVHDGYGETLLYLNLARRLPRDLAVYGIEPRRIRSVPLAHTTIEDMAAFYLQEVRMQQPNGPYMLGGMCAGGVIAYEMAAQLERVGQKVDLVVLLDAAAPRASKRRGRITRGRLRRVQQGMEQIRGDRRGRLRQARTATGMITRKLMNALVWEIAQRGRKWWVRARFRLLCEALKHNSAWPRFLPGLSVPQIYDSAEARYVPTEMLQAMTVLVRARYGESDDTPYREIYADDMLGWTRLANTLEVVDIDGGHTSMLHEHHVDSLAMALEPYVSSKKLASTRVPEVEPLAQ
jgi:FkbH-like protein